LDCARLAAALDERRDGDGGFEQQNNAFIEFVYSFPPQLDAPRVRPRYLSQSDN
jgi:hypothetical protein